MSATMIADSLDMKISNPFPCQFPCTNSDVTCFIEAPKILLDKLCMLNLTLSQIVSLLSATACFANLKKKRPEIKLKWVYLTFVDLHIHNIHSGFFLFIYPPSFALLPTVSYHRWCCYCVFSARGPVPPSLNRFYTLSSCLIYL